MKFPAVPGIILTAACWGGAGQLAAQTGLNPANEWINPLQGVRLYSVSAFGNYSPIRTSTGASEAWRTQSGLAASGGWEFARPTFTFRYRGAYGRAFQEPKYSQTSHSTVFQYTKALAPRWRYSLDVDGRITDFESYLFLPGTLTAPTGSAGVTGDPLAGGGLLDSPSSFAIFGRRILRGTVSNTLTFAKSPRLSYTMSLAGSHTQPIGSNSGFGDPNSRFLRRAENVMASLGIQRVMTPRTTLFADFRAVRNISVLQNAYFTNSLVGLRRNMTPWWSLQGTLGAGYVVPGSSSGLSTRPMPTGGVMTTFTGFGQVLTIGANAFVGDPYAIGATTTYAGTARWGLHRPGSRWAYDLFFMDSLSRSRGGLRLNTWRATAGISRVLTNQLFWRLTAGYTDFDGLNNLLGAGVPGLGSQGRALRGVQMSLTWTPTGLLW